MKPATKGICPSVDMYFSVYFIDFIVIPRARRPLMFVWPGEEQGRIDFTAVEIMGAVSHLKLRMICIWIQVYECL